MAVTDEQVAAMRAILMGNVDEHTRLAQQFDDNNGWEAYSTLLAAAFYEAVDRRFGKSHTLADVIQFVADARTRFDESGQDVDSRAAERLVLAVLGEGSVDDLDDSTVARTQMVLLADLVAQANLDDNGLDEFLSYSRKLADRTMS